MNFTAKKLNKIGQKLIKLWKTSSWPTNIWKSVEHHLSSGNCKLNYNTVSQHICQDTWRRVTITSVGEDVRNRNSFRVWWTCKLEPFWIVSTNTEQMHMLWCSNFTPRYIHLAKSSPISTKRNVQRMLIAVLIIIALNWKHPKVHH